ncbi:hypothetical protein BJV78DRAFT_1230738, partial [Lactifluus subvellereus]
LLPFLYFSSLLAGPTAMRVFAVWRHGRFSYLLAFTFGCGVLSRLVFFAPLYIYTADFLDRLL